MANSEVKVRLELGPTKRIKLLKIIFVTLKITSNEKIFFRNCIKGVVCKENN